MELSFILSSTIDSAIIANWFKIVCQSLLTRIGWVSQRILAGFRSFIQLFFIVSFYKWFYQTPASSAPPVRYLGSMSPTLLLWPLVVQPMRQRSWSPQDLPDYGCLRHKHSRFVALCEISLSDKVEIGRLNNLINESFRLSRKYADRSKSWSHLCFNLNTKLLSYNHFSCQSRADRL